jgi:hypothetical protein
MLLLMWGSIWSLSAMTPSIPDLFSRTKTLSGALEWVEGDREWLSLACPLDIEGVTVAGLHLRMRAIKIYADEGVRAQLEYRAVRGKNEPICRIEWRPAKAHNNKGKGKGPSELRFKLIKGSHIHPFELNWGQDLMATKKGLLPIALPKQQALDSYEEFLVYSGRELRIENMHLIPKPPWEPEMAL